MHAQFHCIIFSKVRSFQKIPVSFARHNPMAHSTGLPSKPIRSIPSLITLLADPAPEVKANALDCIYEIFSKGDAGPITQAVELGVRISLNLMSTYSALADHPAAHPTSC